jgi:hypothetical protein
LIDWQPVRTVDEERIERAKQPKLMIARRRTRVPIAVDRFAAVVADDKYGVTELIEQKVDITQSDLE